MHFLPLLTFIGVKFCVMFARDGLFIQLLIISCRAGQLSPHTSGPLGRPVLWHCFDTLIKKLEETKLCITDVYEEVGKFKLKMLEQKNDSFFGYQAKQLMDKQVSAQEFYGSSMTLSLHTLTNGLISL